MSDSPSGASRPAPAPIWVCEFCFDVSYMPILPAHWDLVWQCAVCTRCQKRVQQDGGYGVVKGGAYAEGKADPRARPVSPETTAATPLKFWCMNPACNVVGVVHDAPVLRPACGFRTESVPAEPSRETQAPKQWPQCSCENWIDQLPKINGPIVTAQLRTGHYVASDYFRAWGFCPWCGRDLAGGGTTPRTPEPETVREVHDRAMALAGKALGSPDRGTFRAACVLEVHAAELACQKGVSLTTIIVLLKSALALANDAHAEEQLS